MWDKIFTTASKTDIWREFPPILQSVFSSNVVAVVFVIAILLNLVLPEHMDIEKITEE